MKAPTCRLCGHAHWPSDPHVFKDEPACALCAELNAKLAALEAENQELRKQLLAANIANSTPVNSRANSRKDYMREYMRAKRAKVKPNG